MKIGDSLIHTIDNHADTLGNITFNQLDEPYNYDMVFKWEDNMMLPLMGFIDELEYYHLNPIYENRRFN